MAIPEQRPSSEPIPGSWVNPPQARPFESFHWGPVHLNDPSQGMFAQLWKLRAEGADLYLSAPNYPEALFLSRSNDIKQVSLAFDQNGLACVAFVEDDDSAYLRWYDPTIPGYDTVALPAGTVTPRVTLDDARDFMNGENDIILMYVRAGALYYRQQRDRFLVEYFLQSGVQELYHVSMNSNLRLQWAYPGAAAPKDPYLAEVVMMICRAAGIPPENVDVSELWDETVPGIAISTDDGLDKPIEWLMEIFQFAKQDRDRKIAFINMGREPVARIPYKDLIIGKPQSLKKTTVDETKLPKEISINHIDPTGGFAKNKQTAQRRSNTINAQEKPNITTQVILTPDQAATAAVLMLKRRWNELFEYEFTTRLKYSFVLPGDVVEVEDADGEWHRVFIEERNEDDGEIQFEGRQDAGKRVWGSKLAGNPLPEPISTTPGLAGETRLDIINVSPNRDQDDELGVYIAASGDNSGWSGYTLLVSTDGGQSYTEAFQSSTPCVMGETLTDLLEEVGYQYQSAQTVEVITNFPLASISYDQLLGNQNRCIIGDEELQFMTATHLGMVGGKYHYRLSGLIRARYNTQPEFWPIGTRFILMDEAIIFLQAQKWMIGMDVYYKAVSFNTSSDEATPLAYLFDDPRSQLEWPPADVKAVRDGSDNVTVTWIEVARLGMDTTPYHSKHTTGYRVKFSDGHTIDVPLGVQVATYPSAPSGLTVQVCGLNAITGEGFYSDPVSDQPLVEQDPHWEDVISLLYFNGANGSTSIVDETGRVWSVYGSAQLSDSDFIHAPSSLLCANASLDRIHTASSADFSYGLGDFTLEGWVKFNPAASGAYQIVLDGRATGFSEPVPTIYLYNGLLRFYTNGADRIITSSPIATGVWMHWMYSRESGTGRLGLSGQIVGSWSDSTNYPSHGVTLGNAGHAPHDAGLRGNLDTVRITKGFARYTGDYIVPAFPFPNK